MSHVNHLVVFVIHPDLFPSSSKIYWTAVGDGLRRLNIVPTTSFHAPDERAQEIASRILSQTGGSKSSELNLLADPVSPCSPLSEEERLFLQRLISHSSVELVEERFLKGGMENRFNIALFAWRDEIYQLFCTCWSQRPGVSLIVGHSLILRSLFARMASKPPDQIGFTWSTTGIVVVGLMGGVFQRAVYFKNLVATLSRPSTSGSGGFRGRNPDL